MDQKPSKRLNIVPVPILQVCVLFPEWKYLRSSFRWRRRSPDVRGDRTYPSVELYHSIDTSQPRQGRPPARGRQFGTGDAKVVSGGINEAIGNVSALQQDVENFC